MQPMTVIMGYCTTYCIGIIMSQVFNQQVKDTYMMITCTLLIIVLSVVGFYFDLN